MKIFVGAESFEIVKETNTRVTDSLGRVWTKPDREGYLTRYGKCEDCAYSARSEERFGRDKSDAEARESKEEIYRLKRAAGIMVNTMYPPSLCVEEVKAHISKLLQQIDAANNLVEVLERYSAYSS
jgi:hypothetical protein